MKYLTLLPVLIILLCTLFVIIHIISFIRGNRAYGPFEVPSCDLGSRPDWQGEVETPPFSSFSCDISPFFSNDDSFINKPPDVPKRSYPELSQFVEKVNSGCYREALSCLPDELLQFLRDYRCGLFDEAFSIIGLASHQVQNSESCNRDSIAQSASEIWNTHENDKPDKNKCEYEV